MQRREGLFTVDLRIYRRWKALRGPSAPAPTRQVLRAMRASALELVYEQFCSSSSNVSLREDRIDVELLGERLDALNRVVPLGAARRRWQHGKKRSADPLLLRAPTRRRRLVVAAVKSFARAKSATTSAILPSSISTLSALRPRSAPRF